MTAVDKPHLTFWQIWNMCLGFLGLQFGFALQNANVSRIFQTLGASIDEIPILWIAAPFTGLVVQPLVGYASDRTWTRLGRRRPYFLAGSALAAIALIAMPHAPVLWVAAALLWMLDASINISMEPIRAFVGDQLAPVQRPAGYAMQSFFIGVGAVVASLLPWLLAHAGVSNHVEGATGFAAIPDTVRYSFYIGAVVLFLAMGWTIVSTREYPPEMLYAGETQESGNMLATIWHDLRHMPDAMRKLIPVQFFSWLALFAMWIYTTPAVTQVHFGTTDPTSDAYNQGANWVGVLFAAYSGFAAIAAIVIPFFVRRFGLRRSHLLNLCIGGVAFISFAVIRDPDWLLLSMVGVGFAWASIVSLPYALLSDSLPPQKMGLYMGVFNFFIVIPQLVAASVLGFLLKLLFHGEPIYALVLGGVSFVIAGLFVLRVPHPKVA
jgi:maltose/moltooligosaccharide transporter